MFCYIYFISFHSFHVIQKKVERPINTTQKRRRGRKHHHPKGSMESNTPWEKERKNCKGEIRPVSTSVHAKYQTQHELKLWSQNWHHTQPHLGSIVSSITWPHGERRRQTAPKEWKGKKTKGQDRTGQDRTGQDRTGQDREGKDRKREKEDKKRKRVKEKGDKETRRQGHKETRRQGDKEKMKKRRKGKKGSKGKKGKKGSKGSKGRKGRKGENLNWLSCNRCDYCSDWAHIVEHLNDTDSSDCRILSRR